MDCFVLLQLEYVTAIHPFYKDVGKHLGPQAGKHLRHVDMPSLIYLVFRNLAHIKEKSGYILIFLF